MHPLKVWRDIKNTSSLGRSSQRRSLLRAHMKYTQMHSHTFPKTTIQLATAVLCLLIQKNTGFSPFHWIFLRHSLSTFFDQIRFLWSCKRLHCQSAGFILLKWLSSSSLQPCHFTLRTADLILPLSLPLSLSLWLLLYFSTLDSHAVNLKCSLQSNEDLQHHQHQNIYLFIFL